MSTGTAASTAYGAVPFELAAGTGKWWKIDSTDTAYWAVQENINAMRAAGGLPALTMDDTLSATASSRCESFVAGGPFDHSGMVTKRRDLRPRPALFGGGCLHGLAKQRDPLRQHHADGHFQHGRELLVL